MATEIETDRRTAKDGRPYALRAARPTDARALARLFADVRAEGRYLITPPGLRNESHEAYFIRELITAGESLILVAEADSAVVANVMVLPEQSRVQDHVGTLSICVASEWRDAGIGSALVDRALAWATEHDLQKVQLSVFPDNTRAIAVYERAGFAREGLRRMQFRASDGAYRDELLMAWFGADAESGQHIDTDRGSAS